MKENNNIPPWCVASERVFHTTHHKSIENTCKWYTTMRNNATYKCTKVYGCNPHLSNKNGFRSGFYFCSSHFPSTLSICIWLCRYVSVCAFVFIAYFRLSNLEYVCLSMSLVDTNNNRKQCHTRAHTKQQHNQKKTQSEEKLFNFTDNLKYT